VINLGSVAGEFPYPGGNVHGATNREVEVVGERTAEVIAVCMKCAGGIDGEVGGCGRRGCQQACQCQAGAKACTCMASS